MSNYFERYRVNIDMSDPSQRDMILQEIHSELRKGRSVKIHVNGEPVLIEIRFGGVCVVADTETKEEK